MRQECSRKADVQPAAADGIDHADFARELERVVEDRQQRAHHKTRAFRALRGSGKKDQGIRAVATVLVEVVLDDTHMGEAEVVGAVDHPQRLGEIAVARDLLGGYIGEKLNAEFHDASFD